MLEFSNKNSRITCKILSKSIIEVPDVVLVSIVKFEYISHVSSVLFLDFEHVNVRLNALLP